MTMPLAVLGLTGVMAVTWALIAMAVVGWGPSVDTIALYVLVIFGLATVGLGFLLRKKDDT